MCIKKLLRTRFCILQQTLIQNSEIYYRNIQHLHDNEYCAADLLVILCWYHGSICVDN